MDRTTYFLPPERFDEIKKKYPMFNEPWTEEEVNKLSDLANEHLTQKEMSARMGRSPKSIKLKLIELGLYTKAQASRPWSEEEELRLIELYNMGADFQNISLELGRSEQAIVKRLVFLRVKLFDRKDS